MQPERAAASSRYGPRRAPGEPGGNDGRDDVGQSIPLHLVSALHQRAKKAPAIRAS